MSAPSELRTVAARRGAVSLLSRHAALDGCAVVVLDHGLAPVVGTADGTPVAWRPEGARPVAEGAGATAPVRAFDRVVGWVVAAPRDDDAAGPPQARDVAARSADLLTDLCSREFELNDLAREILGAYEELNLFYELSAELATASDPGAICRTVARMAVRVMGVERAWILLRPNGPGVLEVAAAENPPDGAGAVGAGEGAAGRVLASRTAEILEDAGQVAEAMLAGWERTATRGLVTVPICVPGREGAPVLGVLQVADPRDRAPFSAADLKLATALATNAAVLVENQRLIAYERELAIARTIQRSLLPARAPEVAGLDVAGSCVPASAVGGDYYDHVAVGPSGLGVVIADVSGHNLASALLQTTARSVLRAEALSGAGPSTVLERANRALHEDLERSELFLTAWYGVFDGATGRFAMSDAGHPPALVWRRDSGTVEDVSAGGPPLGVDPAASYESSELRLRPGDVVVAYTDGLTETRSRTGDEEYGVERLAAALARSADGSAAEIVAALLRDVAAWDGGGAAADDRSVVVVKVRGTGSR